jgi:hypothetical protein
MPSTTAIRRRHGPTGRKAGTKTSRAGRRLRTSIVLACAVVGALLAQTAVASAASRGFDIRNSSNRGLKLQSVQKVRTFTCTHNVQCFPDFYAMEFEGRPGSGDRLDPGTTHRFELKWEFSFDNSVKYAAEATYNIEGTNAQLQVTMKTSTLSNTSTCRVLHAPVGSCIAEGLNIFYFALG